MAEQNADTATAAGKTRSAENIGAIVSRILNLSIFFIGIGVYAAVGFAMAQIELFVEFQLTYFAVGAVVGVVGILLWIATR